MIASISQCFHYSILLAFSCIVHFSKFNSLISYISVGPLINLGRQIPVLGFTIVKFNQ